MNTKITESRMNNGQCIIDNAFRSQFGLEAKQ